MQDPKFPEEFLQAFLDSNLTLAALAGKLNLTALQLSEAAVHPSIQPHLQALEDLAAIRVRIAAADSRLVAIQALRKNLDIPDLDPTERRRAAALLLRNLNLSDSAARDLSAAAGCAPAPLHSPRKLVNPDVVTHAVIDSMRANDRPVPDTGLATLHANLDPEASIGEDDHEVGLRAVEDFILDPPALLEPLLNAGRVVFHTTEYPKYDADKAVQTVTIYPRRPILIAGAAPPPPATEPAPADPAPTVLHFIFRRQLRGPHTDCYLIRAILTDAQRQALDPPEPPRPPRTRAKQATNGAIPDSS